MRPEEGEGSMGWDWNPPSPVTSHEAKLRSLLRDLFSPELQIQSRAAKEFIFILRGESGGEALLEYVRGSPRCSELADAWNLRQGKSGMAHVLALVAAIVGHPFGRSAASGICRNIESFARSIVTTKLEDIYAELKSKEGKRQAAALSLMAAVVRRGVGLASEVAKNFDFKLLVQHKFAGFRKKKGGRETKQQAGRPWRRAFAEFSVSFLEVGNPRLLRWILQQKEMYFGLLQGLGSDDLETVVYVLSTLRDKVLCAESLVPPGLRSVLFGSATLEQLSYISGNPEGREAADIAHEVLTMVCTDPSNGLMPEGNLKGNVKRLSDFMKKLKATESAKHKELLLAIVKGRPFLCSLYMDEFPYHLEPRPSVTWYSAVSLASDLISAVNFPTSFSFLRTSKFIDPPSLDSVEVQSILKCIVPRCFTRPVINRGLLHSDSAVKHGSLRLLLGALELLESLNSLFEGFSDIHMEESAVVSGEIGPSNTRNIYIFGDPYRLLGGETTDLNSALKTKIQAWTSLKENILDEIRSLLPDPQVLLKLLTSFNYRKSEATKFSLKRCVNYSQPGCKKIKHDCSTTHGDVDMVLGVLNTEVTSNMLEDFNKTKDADVIETEERQKMAVPKIWGPHLDTITQKTGDFTTFFHVKLLDVIRLYLRTMPFTLEGTFDLVKLLPSNPAVLSCNQQQAMLSLLVEYVGLVPGRKASSRLPDGMFKSLQPVISLLISSPIQSIQDQAILLAHAAMRSTGAFDYNLSEIDAWFLFLPGYYKNKNTKESQVPEEFRELSTVVISFLCDAVSTVGNNLYKHLDLMRSLITKLYGHEDSSPHFSPLIMCILQKCIRVLESDFGTFRLLEKSMISVYVRNTLSFLLQAQVDAKMLSGFVSFMLNGKLNGPCTMNGDYGRSSLCEWRPLNDLLFLAQRIFHEQIPSLRLVQGTSKGRFNTFFPVICKVREFLDHGDGDELVSISKAMCFSIICASPDDLVENFPMLLAIVHHVPRAHIPFLIALLLLQGDFLGNIINRWPDIVPCSLDKISIIIDAYQKCEASSVPGESCLISTSNTDAMESLAVAFRFMLDHASFYAFFYGVMNSGTCSLFRSHKIVEILYAKLEVESSQTCVLFLQIILFRAYQICSHLKTQQSGDLEQMFEFCLDLVDHILDKILVQPSGVNTSNSCHAPVITDYILQVADTIFHHPVVTLSICNPSCTGKMPTQEFMGGNFVGFFESSKQYIHLMDYRILHLLTRLGEFMLVFRHHQTSASNLSLTPPEIIMKALVQLVKQTVSLFKEKLALCITTKDVGSFPPTFYIFGSLMQYVSPFELLELVDWMFCKIHDNLDHLDSKDFIFSVCFYVVNVTLEMFYNLMPQRKVKLCSFLWDLKNRAFSVSILKNIYWKIMEFTILFKLDSADSCLLTAVDAVCRTGFTQDSAALPSTMELSRTIMSSPMKLITHCIYQTNKVKSWTLFKIIRVSPLHSGLFGMIFFSLLKEISSKDITNMDDAWPPMVYVAVGNSDLSFLDEDLVILLPAVLSYLTYLVSKFRKHGFKLFGHISSFYSRIILQGFSNWKDYCSRKVFHEDLDKYNLKSAENFLDCFTSTLLGKTIHMLRLDFILNGGLLKKKHRLDIFASIFDCTSLEDQLFDCDVRDINPQSCDKSFNLINRAIAKISLTKLLLSHPRKQKEFSTIDADVGCKDSSRKKSSSKNCAKLRFLNILFNSLGNLVRRFPWKENPSQDADCSYMFRWLEVHLLRNIVEISLDLRSFLIQSQSVGFLNSFVKSSLLHRFEDPTTLRAIRIVLCNLGTKALSLDILELLLGHSEFVATILRNDQNSDMSSSILPGTLLLPSPSIFKLIKFSSPGQGSATSKVPSGSGNRQYTLDKRKLELIKLLRVLFHLRNVEQKASIQNVDGVNHGELLSLLLSGYGASISEIDLEMLHLMHEIESVEGVDCHSIAAMDFLWGDSAIKLRQEQRFDLSVSQSKISDLETEDERRKRLFREYVPVNSRQCLMTALHFCYDRAKLIQQMSLRKLLADSVMNTVEQTPSLFDHKIQQYDPGFMLPFSIHSLHKGYLEPIEFVRLGLLSVALVSLSSADEEIRKLGYEVVGTFKMILENHQGNKDVLKLRLLLAYLQNGITDAWQKIPSVISLFTAEASFVLLDPSHDNFQNINKFLLHSPKADLTTIPVFHSLFASDSVHFEANRKWILQLLFSGLNSDLDSQIFTRKLVFELLQSFYMSSISDFPSRVFILQIVKKSVKLHTLTIQLVKCNGLLPWLQSIISCNAETLGEDQEDISMEQMESALEVINSLVSLPAISDWLRDVAFEQLSNISQSLYGVFIVSLKQLKRNVSLVTSILRVIASTLKISQKREKFKPHFTLSIEALLQLCQAIDCQLKDARFLAAHQLGLTIILMSTPPPAQSPMDKVNLSNLVTWAISAASQLDATQKSLDNISFPDFVNLMEKQKRQEPMLSKILRWITASIISGLVLDVYDGRNSSFSLGDTSSVTLQFLMEKISTTDFEKEDRYNCINESLADIILHLHFLLGLEHATSPSAVSAVCLLLFGASRTGTDSWYQSQANRVRSLSRNIRCPCEVDPSWRWSFDEPCMDLSLDQTDLQTLEEQQSCQILMLLFSNLLGTKSNSQVELYEDLERSGLFTWERSILVGH